MTAERKSLSNVDLNLLLALEALLQERNVSRAGERLSVTQPTMSGALARLRRLFDDELLVRAGRTMQLTPLAETLALPVAEILTQIERTMGATRSFDPRTDARTFKLVATDYALLVLIRPTLQALTHSAPGIRLQVRTTGFTGYPSLLQRGEIDLAIVPEPLSRSTGMPAEPVLDDRFVAVVWRQNPDVGKRLTIEHLRRLPYLGYRFGSSTSMADQPLHDHTVTRDPDTLVESFVLGAHMIRGTRQVTFLQERLAKLFQETDELRLMKPPIRTPALTETMSWHPRNSHDPAHRWLRDQIHQTADALGP